MIFMFAPRVARVWQYDELMLCSYADRGAYVSSPVNEPDGCVLVWNLHLPTRPEFDFYCQSPVLAAMFHPQNPKYVPHPTSTPTPPNPTQLDPCRHVISTMH